VSLRSARRAVDGPKGRELRSARRAVDGPKGRELRSARRAVDGPKGRKLRSARELRPRGLCALFAAIALLVAPTRARADELATLTLPKPRGLHVESVETAFTAYEQKGFGFQSKAGSRSILDAGSERLTVFQPQVLVMLRQDERITHRLWVPIDVVTSASANAIDRGRVDTLSNASRQNQAIALDWTTTYDVPRAFAVSSRSVVHIEENFRSIASGLAATVSLADDNATLAASANQAFDWFSVYDVLGYKHGRQTRSTTNGNIGLTQILTPTTVAHVNYGLSAQSGEMSNTWNSVPDVTGTRIQEHLRRHRIRHAFVGRFAQYLPWDGALKGFYRFYVDDWGLVAHAAEVQLLQRLTPIVYIRGSYRFYRQTAVDFFTTLADRSMAYYTADSDLGAFDSHTVGGKVTVELPILMRGAHVDAGYERYWRTDGLRVNVALWQAGGRF
jgi:hypothetical protein